MKSELKFLVSGDRGLLIKLGESIHPETSRKVHLLTAALKRKALPGVEEIVPGYCTLLVLFNPLRSSYSSLVGQIQESAATLNEVELPLRRCIEVPVCYGGRYGPDLREVGSYHRLSEGEIVRVHTSATYLVTSLDSPPVFHTWGKFRHRSRRHGLLNREYVCRQGVWALQEIKPGFIRSKLRGDGVSSG